MERRGERGERREKKEKREEVGEMREGEMRGVYAPFAHDQKISTCSQYFKLHEQTRRAKRGDGKRREREGEIEK